MIADKYTDLLFKNNYCATKEIKAPNINIHVSHLADKKKVLIISKSSIDNGAGGTRISNLVDLLDYTGNFNTSAYVFSKGKAFGDVIKENNCSRFVALDDYSEFNGIQKYKKLFYSKKVVKKIIDIERPDILIVYSVLSFRNISFIKRYTKKKNIRLVFDVVESRKLFSSFSPFALFGYNLHNYLINNFFINKKTDSVICCTSYLYDFFTKSRKCKKVFLLPITMRVMQLPKYNKNNQIDKIVFLYAGSPANKIELIGNIIKGFNMLPEEYKNKILFVVCGPSTNFLLKHEHLPFEEYQKSKEFTLYFGSIDKRKLYKMYPNVDYSVLIRNPKKRFAKAGFPTKMAESISCAIPMVANLSGDMGRFLSDDYNSYISESLTAEDFKKALIKAIENYESRHHVLSQNAVTTAVNKLDNFAFYEKFYYFIK